MQTREKVTLCGLLGLLMLLDGSISYLFAGTLHQFPNTMITRLTVLGLLLMVFFAPNFNHLVITALVLGLLYDSFYSGVLGIYMFLFPVVVYLTRWMAKFFAPTPLIIGAIYLIGLTVLESAVYAMNTFMGQTTLPLNDFIPNVLGPTLALNLVLFIILYLPLRQLIAKLASVY